MEPEEQSGAIDDSKEQLQEPVQQQASPTDVEFEGGIKVSKDVFEKQARELFKDRFEAYDNREKWQAENTRKAQEYADYRRKAEMFDRLQQERQLQNPKERAKQEYLESMKRDFPDVDTRFFESQFEWNMRLAQEQANQALRPIHEQNSMQFEREFLKNHPDVKPNSDEYFAIGDLIGKGVDAETAYKIIFQDQLVKRQAEEMVKAREAEAKRKLQQSRQQGNQAFKPKSKNTSDMIWESLEAHGYQRP